MFKVFSILIVCAAILFFAIGGVLVWKDVMSVNTYATTGGIVGSMASILGLLAFASPRLTDKDVLSVEGQLVQRLADATASLHQYEDKISENKSELEQLQKDRLEIELLVRQASVKVFLEEKLKRLSAEIEDRIAADHILVDWLIEYEKSKASVAEIDGETSRSKQAELIKEVVGDFVPAQKKLYLEIAGARVDVSPILRVSEQLAVGLVSGLTGLRKLNRPGFAGGSNS